MHLERHQPAARSRLGYLEKHKDYVKRARDFHRKHDIINNLWRKAYFRNEDEFNTSMLRHYMEDGETFKKVKKQSSDELKLLETQDAQYVGMRELIDRKAVEKLSASLHFLDAPRANKHTIFVDEETAEACSAQVSATAGCLSSSSRGAAADGKKLKRRLKDFDVAAYFDTHPALLSQKSNRLRLGQLKTEPLVKSKSEEAIKDAQISAYKELFGRQERAKKLRRVREELELRANLRTKVRYKKMSEAKDGHPAVYRWNSERKR